MGMQWYIIHTYSGFEKKVKESLESRVAAFSLQDKIGRVLIPTEEVVEVRGGKKVVSNRMSYPGYVLVEMNLDENTWHTVRSTPRVTGFVGSATSPSPLTEAEVDGIINRVHTPLDRPKPKVVFERNEQVRIVDGPFANFNGNVEEIDNDHSRLKVSVTIFGRYETLGIRPTGKMQFRTIDGRILEREVAPVFVRTNGHIGGDTIVMAETGDAEVWGAHTLESLGLAADPVQKKLIPTVGLAFLGRVRG